MGDDNNLQDIATPEKIDSVVISLEEPKGRYRPRQRQTAEYRNRRAFAVARFQQLYQEAKSKNLVSKPVDFGRLIGLPTPESASHYLNGKHIALERILEYIKLAETAFLIGQPGTIPEGESPIDAIASHHRPITPEKENAARELGKIIDKGIAMGVWKNFSHAKQALGITSKVSKKEFFSGDQMSATTYREYGVKASIILDEKPTEVQEPRKKTIPKDEAPPQQIPSSHEENPVIALARALQKFLPGTTAQRQTEKKLDRILNILEQGNRNAADQKLAKGLLDRAVKLPLNSDLSILAENLDPLKGMITPEKLELIVKLFDWLCELVIEIARDESVDKRVWAQKTLNPLTNRFYCLLQLIQHELPLNAVQAVEMTREYLRDFQPLFPRQKKKEIK
jgi:hypothetical protein